MASILIVFDTRYGQSSKIAERIGEVARRSGHAPLVTNIDAVLDLPIGRHDAVVVVAPVYFGHHSKKVDRFVRVRADLLSLHPSAFFSVSNSAANPDPTARANAERLAQDFVSATGWRPTIVATAGGAILYRRYNFILRFVMRRIAREGGMPTDTSRDHELTDWAAVDSVAAAFTQALEASGTPKRTSSVIAATAP